MNLSIIATLVYGILAMIGGIIGYIQANSQVSLVSGVISGLLLLVAGYFQIQGESWALIVAVLVTVILVIFFALRFAKTRKFMPGGLMVILGMLALALMVHQLIIGR
ncbi:TMEM14 family protein [Nodularia harveyana UHCC-0300]|uniref:TMEM14 family protein n=1 Tax=Nodularia harveyana UHCC-0300 TaxID=2974287 RepID=A0ABU5UGV8_9CYAN|nr:TMEM14 family protein [Nodularia harveyana]MEA5582216.1 TMEM14 family protein [Nodularia harveyana UHCC-0300]